MKTISVTVASRVTVIDDDGDSTVTETSTVYDGCLLAPPLRHREGHQTDDAPTVVATAVLYREGGMAVDADDEIHIEGVSPQIDGVWQVAGAPGYWPDGVQVAVTRTGSL